MKESLKMRAARLIRKSREGIARTEGTPNNIQCGMCNRKALRNLKAEDYYEYWLQPVPEKYKGVYLCISHTQQLNAHLIIKSGSR